MSSDFVQAVKAVVGSDAFFTGPEARPYCEDKRGRYAGDALAVVFPSNTDQVSRIVRLCAAKNIAIVPQGGNTSLCGASVPLPKGDQIVLNLSRMNRILAVDAVDYTMTVEAGCKLASLYEAAEKVDRLFPLGLTAIAPHCEIGGNLSTNAGGIGVLRYGNARDLVLGLEVVLADGAVWNGLRRLRKDNTGYALRQLFVGSEGTLGIITAAVLKLVPAPRERAVALCAVASAAAALDLLGRFQAHDPGAVTAFEYMSGLGMGFVLAHIPGARLPFAAPAEHYVLVELATPRAGAGLRAGLETVLEAALAAALVTDAVIAESEAQRAALWKLREEHSEAQKREGASVKNDVSVPVSAVPEFIAEATAACLALMPGIRAVPFGHLGDGNIHFNLEQPKEADAAWFLAQDHAIMDTVNAVVRRFDGSFSAEHGVGRLKPYMMPEWRGGAELDVMRRIKAALDPGGISNPGKVLP